MKKGDKVKRTASTYFGAIEGNIYTILEDFSTTEIKLVETNDDIWHSKSSFILIASPKSINSYNIF